MREPKRVRLAREVLGAARAHRLARVGMAPLADACAPLVEVPLDRVVVETDLRALLARVDYQSLGPVPALTAIAARLP